MLIINDERFDAYSRLIKMADLVPAMSIRAGVTLGLFGELKKSSGDTDALARRVRIPSSKIDALLRVLESLELVRLDQGSLYQLTAMGELLADGGQGLSKVFDLDSAVGQYEYSVTGLVDSLREGRSYFASRFDSDYWQLVDGNAKDRSLVAYMSTATPVFDADQLIDDGAWDSVSSVIDLGGGNGNILIALAEKHAHLRGVVFDLPGRVESARQLIDEHGLSSRLGVIGGSFFEHVPEGFDCYLLNAILADWSNSQCAQILRKIRKAMGNRGGLLLVSEVDPVASLGDPSVHLKMICSAEGWIRTPDEVYGVLAESGFELVSFSNSRCRFTQLYRPV